MNKISCLPSPPAGQPLRVALFRARAARLGLRRRRLPRPDRAAARVPHEAPQHHPADGKEGDSQPPPPLPSQYLLSARVPLISAPERNDEASDGMIKGREKGRRVIAPAAIPGRSAAK